MNNFHHPPFHLPPPFVSLSPSLTFSEGTLLFFLSFFLSFFPSLSLSFSSHLHTFPFSKTKTSPPDATRRDFPHLSRSNTFVFTHSFFLCKHSFLLTLINPDLLDYFHHASLQLLHLLPCRCFSHTSLISPPQSYEPSTRQQSEANFDSRQHMWRREWLQLQSKRLIWRKLLLRCRMVRCVVLLHLLTSTCWLNAPREHGGVLRNRMPVCLR